MIALAAIWCKGMPSTNTFAAVTNDWYNANFTNVYELAQQRMANNSNDVVAAYLMLDWNAAFGSVVDISNSVTHVVRTSDLVTNTIFSAKYQIFRPSYLSYRDEFLATQTSATLDNEKFKSYLPHKAMASEYMLKLLDIAGLW